MEEEIQEVQAVNRSWEVRQVRKPECEGSVPSDLRRVCSRSSPLPPPILGKSYLCDVSAGVERTYPRTKGDFKLLFQLLFVG